MLYSKMNIVLFLAIVVLPLQAQPTCESGDKIITVHVTAEFFQRSLSKAPSTQKTVASSKAFTSAYEEYYESVGKSKYTINQKEEGSLNFTGSYSPLSAIVSEDITYVITSVSSYATSTDSSDYFRQTEVAPDEEYYSGFHQIVRRLRYTVIIDGVMATLEEELISSSISREESLLYHEVLSFGKRHISDRYSNAGGSISANSFTQTKCYKQLNMEETSRLTALENVVQTQDNELTTLKASLATQNGELTTQKASLIVLDDELTTQRASLTTQDDELTTLKRDLTTQYTKITTLEDKQTKIINPPTGSLRSAACIVTCAGSTGEDSTDWSSGSAGVSTVVDISSCGFVSTPVITASVEGTAYHYFMTQAVYRASSTVFTMYMSGWVYTTTYPTGLFSSSDSHTPATYAARYNWNVHWSATGYTC